VLSHYIVIISLGSLIYSSFSNRNINKASFITYNSVRSLASIVDIITISYLLTFYIIKPPNNLIVYPYELFLSIILSINEVLLATLR